MARIVAVLVALLLAACLDARSGEPLDAGGDTGVADLGRDESVSDTPLRDTPLRDTPLRDTSDASAVDTSDASDLGDGDVLEDAPDVLTDAQADAVDLSEADTREDAASADLLDDAIGDPVTDPSGDDVDDVDGGDADVGDLADARDVRAFDGGLGPIGVISGACDVLDDELISDQPWVFVNAIDFGELAFDEEAFVARLSAGGMTLYDAGTAGGSSIWSEVFAFEMLSRCEGAELLASETMIRYVDGWDGSITDMLVTIEDVSIGVSVTRAVAFPFDDPYTVERATDLLERKLADVLESSAGVREDFAWEKQILHVIAYGESHVESLQTALDSLSDELLSDTIVVITRSDGADGFLY